MPIPLRNPTTKQRKKASNGRLGAVDGTPQTKQVSPSGLTEKPQGFHKGTLPESLRCQKNVSWMLRNNDLHDHCDHIRPLQLSHPIVRSCATHCAWEKLQTSVLSARSHLATVEIEVVQEVSAAQFYNAHGLSAISKCSNTEATTGTIIASEYVETIHNVAPHSRGVPRAGNGAPRAECFPLIGLKVRGCRKNQWGTITQKDPMHRMHKR